MNAEKYDVIIVGSGISALTCASLLAQLKHKRVLVLERDFKIGGLTHTFKRKSKHGNYSWDIGLHYVGQMHNGSMPRAMFDLVTRGKVVWNKMPEIYDVYVFPGLKFEVREGELQFKFDLLKQFPNEKEAIENYFSDLRKANKWLGKHMMGQSLPRTLRAVASLFKSSGFELALLTTGEYLNKNFKDEKLKAVLTSQWSDYGLPPSQSAFIVHAMIASHYFDGGYYPIGGSKTIADSVIPIVEANSGKLLVNNMVEEIIVEKGKAVGVRVAEKHGDKFVEKKYFADTIISSAGAYVTYAQLMPKKINHPFIEEVKRAPSGVGHVNLYIGLKENPGKLGIKGENYWIYDSFNHDKTFAERNEIINGKVRAVYVSFPSMKDPLAADHTAEIISLVDYTQFKKWAKQPWKNRDEEYLKLKEKISVAMIDYVDKHLPGFKKLIDYKELSTPLSTEFFTGSKEGSFYGIPATPERFKMKWISPHTPVKNLYLTGADAGSFGITGAMMTGAITTGIILGAPGGIVKVFKEAMKFHRSVGR